MEYQDIENEKSKFNGMIDDEAAYLLSLAKKDKVPFKKVSNFQYGDVYTIVKIVHIFIKNENKVSAIVGDETGHCILSLWDNHVDFGYALKEGDVIQISNGFVRNRIRGKEINVGKFGMIDKSDKKIMTHIRFGKKLGIFNIKGDLIKKYSTQMYIDDFEHFMCQIKMDDFDVILLDDRVKDIQKYNEQDPLQILWVHQNSHGKIYADECSVIRFDNR